MRAKVLLVGGLTLLVGGLALLVGPGSDRGGSHDLAPLPPGPSHAPAPLKRELLTGKWKTSTDTPFIAGYEFADGGALKLSIRQMNQPITGTYACDGDRTLRLKYDLPPHVKKEYDAAAQAFKEGVRKRIQARSLPYNAGPSLLGTVPDELPSEESVRVSISEKPLLLFLTAESGPRTYEGAD
jgi:hypothetical protein